MVKIKHVTGYEFDGDKLNAIHETFARDCKAEGIPCMPLTQDNLDNIMLELIPKIMQKESIAPLGLNIALKQIDDELKKIPVLKRLFMTGKRKKLERAKITLRLIKEGK